MKHTIFLSVMLFFCLHLFAQKEVTQKFNTKIQAITVYLNNAEIMHNQPVKLQPGRNLLVFEGLSPQLIEHSIRVSTDEKISVLSISSKTNFLTKNEEKPRIKQLKDSLKILNQLVIQTQNDTNALFTEKRLLLKNTSIGGVNTGVNINDLKTAADYYRSRIMEVNQKLSLATENMNEYQKKIDALTSELSELNASISFERAEIYVLLSTENEVNTNIELYYLVSDAGWAPSYEIKTEDIDKAIELNYRAKVFNNTRIDWQNTKLKLSTGDPNLSAAKPELKPWFLNFYNYQYNNSKSDLMINQGMVQSNAIYLDERQVKKEISSNEFEVREVEVSELSAEFEIKTDYSIPADNKPYLVDVTEYQLPATYKHVCIPKMDKDVFLIAQVAGWEDLNLVEGPANVYFGGTFVGESYIQTRNVKDTLDLSLGRDKKVIVTRTKLKDYSSTKFIGGKRKETFTYQMIAKNNRKAPIAIDILDQLPISQNSEIEVEILDISKAERNINNGELKWKYTIAPSQTETINLSFAIKYPKNTTVRVEQKRSTQMRYYK